MAMAVVIIVIAMAMMVILFVVSIGVAVVPIMVFVIPVPFIVPPTFSIPVVVGMRPVRTRKGWVLVVTGDPMIVRPLRHPATYHPDHLWLG
jgi:hypothetical protein